jgi:hypothetical protein
MLQYTVNGCGLYRSNGLFSADLGGLKITIPAEHVDMTMMWYKLISGDKYWVQLRERGMVSNVDLRRQHPTFILTDNTIQFGDQTVSPYFPFNIEESDNFIGLNIYGKRCLVTVFVALSVAVNGAHLLY